MKKQQEVHVESKKRLTLDDFKMKANLAQTQDALEAVTGGILGAGPDDGGTPITTSQRPSDIFVTK